MNDASSTTTKPPAQRTLCKIVSHDKWCCLLSECRAVDAINDADPYFTFINRECCRLISTSGDYSGAWLDVLPTSVHLQSNKFQVALQRRLGLYVSAATDCLDAKGKAEGGCRLASGRV